MSTNPMVINVFNHRTTVRREVLRIISQRVPEAGGIYEDKFLERQSFILEDLLYKLAFTMGDYGDLNTVEARLQEASNMILLSSGHSVASLLAAFLEAS
mmetsp:Transcript_30190/g.61453  ORF Transcript_30190/g.61453 Transcript_30190/m.61453 type:complete len:99 (+) Transcript_30190:59-355(+)